MSVPWSPFYWRDYTAKTGHLTLAEHGAYLLLMAHYYQTGYLPANAVQLQKICRAFADAERDAITSVLQQFFRLEGERYVHDRIEQELAKSAHISETRRDAANKKHQKHHTNAPANAVQLHTQPQPHKEKTEPSLSELRKQNPACFDRRSLENSDHKIAMIAKLHPKLAHLQETEIPMAITTAIIAAIESETEFPGRPPMSEVEAMRYVFAETQKVMDAAKSESKSDFVLGPDKFWMRREYRPKQPAVCAMQPTPLEQTLAYRNRRDA